MRAGVSLDVLGATYAQASFQVGRDDLGQGGCDRNPDEPPHLIELVYSGLKVVEPRIQFVFEVVDGYLETVQLGVEVLFSYYLSTVFEIDEFHGRLAWTWVEMPQDEAEGDEVGDLGDDRGPAQAGELALQAAQA